MLAPDRTFARRDTALFILCLVAVGRGTVRARDLAVRHRLLRPEHGPGAAHRAAASRRGVTDQPGAVRPADRRSAIRPPSPLSPSPPSSTKTPSYARSSDCPGGSTQRVVPAEVLHQPLPTDGRTLLLSAGRQSGIAPFQAVVSPEGLLGFILTAGASNSIVLTWAHPDFRASAVTLDGSVTGIVERHRGRHDPRTDAGAARGSLSGFRSGRDSLSSPPGLGGVYPRGLPIGTVVGVARQSEGWERVYLVRPAAAPARVSHVLVLPGRHGVDRAAAGGFHPVSAAARSAASASAWSCCSSSGCSSTCGPGSAIRGWRPTS